LEAWRNRPAADTERALLGDLGYTLPEELLTRVMWRRGSIRERRWPQLETPAPQQKATNHDTTH
jgi:hypothetical protein